MKITENYTADALSLAKALFNYLYLRNEISNADAIIGFGHFDEKVPKHCGELYSNGFGKLIIFSGGIGSGSTGLIKPEAQEFFEKLQLQFPEIEPDKVILEDKSTNTGENIRFTLSLLEKFYSSILDPGQIQKLILVATAYRQRRAWLTCRKYLKKAELLNSPPITNFENELIMFDHAGENLLQHLVDEMERINTYPARGFIEYSEIPAHIMEVTSSLKKLIKNN
jgi:uncharacterized SAM-binding protein YcdF (DUF218 family)